MPTLVQRVPKKEDGCSFVQPIGRLIYGFRHIDIFHFTRVGAKLLDVPDIEKQYNRTDFYPFVRCNFIDTSTWCPSNPRKVLEIRYGLSSSEEELVCENGQWKWKYLRRYWENYNASNDVIHEKRDALRDQNSEKHFIQHKKDEHFWSAYIYAVKNKLILIRKTCWNWDWLHTTSPRLEANFLNWYTYLMEVNKPFFQIKSFILWD